MPERIGLAAALPIVRSARPSYACPVNCDVVTQAASEKVLPKLSESSCHAVWLAAAIVWAMGSLHQFEILLILTAARVATSSSHSPRWLASMPPNFEKVSKKMIVTVTPGEGTRPASKRRQPARRKDVVRKRAPRRSLPSPHLTAWASRTKVLQIPQRPSSDASRMKVSAYTRRSGGCADPRLGHASRSRIAQGDSPRDFKSARGTLFGADANPVDGSGRAFERKQKPARK